MTCRVLFLSAAIIASAVAADPAETQVANSFEQYRKARNSSDAAALDKLLADNFLFIMRSGQTIGKQEMLSSASEKRMAKADHKNVKIRVYGNAAVVTTETIVQPTTASPSKVLTTHVMVKQSGAWRLVSMPATAAPAS